MLRTFHFSETEIPGAVIIRLFQANDERGETIKGYSNEVFQGNGIDFTPMETLLIKSRRGVLRGLHFQRCEKSGKLVHCILGKVWVVVVDLRVESKTFGSWISAELSGKSQDAVYVPEGCALGSLALEESLFFLACGAPFRAEYEDGIRWDDPELVIRWPADDLTELVISEKDRALQSFAQYREGNT